MEVTLWHGIEYEVTEPVAVDDLSKSLEANAKLLRHAGDLLTEVFPALSMEAKRISVVRLSQESPLSELFAYAVVLAYQKELEAEVPQLIEHLTGVHVADSYDTIVTVIVALIAVHGIGKAFDALFPGKEKKALDQSKESLLKRAAALTGATAERIQGALMVLFTGRQHRGLVLASQRAFAPTRGHSRASIRERSGETLIGSDAVSLAQSAAGIPYEGNPEEEVPKTASEFHQGVRIILHAMDKDRKRSGWAGHIPSISDDRIPMVLEKKLRPDSLFGKGEITGDILLTREEDENGDMQPKELLLIQAYME